MTMTVSNLDRPFDEIKVDGVTIWMIKCNTLETPTHGQILPWCGYGKIDRLFLIVVIILMSFSCLVVKECYAQTRKPSEPKEKEKSKKKTRIRHPDAKFNFLEAEKKLRTDWNTNSCLSNHSAVNHACCTRAKIIDCPHITPNDFANQSLGKEVQKISGA